MKDSASFQNEKSVSERSERRIEWIGEIPDEWEVHPVYYYFEERKNKNSLGKEQNLLSLSYGKVVRRNINSVDGLLPESFNTYNIVEENDVIIRPTDLQNDKRSLRTGLCKEHGIITSAYIALKPKHIFSHYYHYLLHAYDVEKVFYNMGNGVRQGLNYPEFSKLLLISPPLPTQKKISDFLDEKCAKIDSLSANLNKQIELLEEYKKSLITECVTHGINADANMKASGIEWIGEIPENWKMDKLKYNLKVHEVKDHADSEVLSLYRELGVIPKNSRDDNHNVTSEDTSKYKFVRKGDFVINKMKAWQGSVAVSDYEGIVSPAYYVYEFINQNYDKKYFHHMMRNKTLADEFKRISGGIREGQWDLDRTEFENMYLPFPPLAEQSAIADYLDAKCSKIESAIASKKLQLEKLEEYKKSLIFEYVTGKKEC